LQFEANCGGWSRFTIRIFYEASLNPADEKVEARSFCNSKPILGTIESARQRIENTRREKRRAFHGCSWAAGPSRTGMDADQQG